MSDERRRSTDERIDETNGGRSTDNPVNVMDIIRAVGRLKAEDRLIVNLGPHVSREQVDAVKVALGRIDIAPERIVVAGIDSFMIVEPPLVEPTDAQRGADMVKAIQAYERENGNNWRSPTSRDIARSTLGLGSGSDRP